MSKVIKMTLDELKTHCLSCTECELCKAAPRWSLA